MADTANEKIVPPSFDGLAPKEMRRAWLRFMADRDWDRHDELFIAAEQVRLSIEMLILNVGRDAESWAGKQLEHQLAAFSAVWSQWRG